MFPRNLFALSAISLCTFGCSTLNESLQLGGSLGAASGAAATYAAYSAQGHPPPGGALAMSAGIGMGVGLLTSYLVHRRVESDRADCEAEQTEMHFGDLPPSPFVVPRIFRKGGAR